jgi:hypothetical protein
LRVESFPFILWLLLCCKHISLSTSVVIAVISGQRHFRTSLQSRKFVQLSDEKIKNRKNEKRERNIMSLVVPFFYRLWKHITTTFFFSTSTFRILTSYFVWKMLAMNEQEKKMKYTSHKIECWYKSWKE